MFDLKRFIIKLYKEIYGEKKLTIAHEEAIEDAVTYLTSEGLSINATTAKNVIDSKNHIIPFGIIPTLTLLDKEIYYSDSDKYINFTTGEVRINVDGYGCIYYANSDEQTAKFYGKEAASYAFQKGGIVTAISDSDDLQEGLESLKMFNPNLVKELKVTRFIDRIYAVLDFKDEILKSLNNASEEEKDHYQKADVDYVKIITHIYKARFHREPSDTYCKAIFEAIDFIKEKGLELELDKANLESAQKVGDLGLNDGSGIIINENELCFEEANLADLINFSTGEIRIAYGDSLVYIKNFESSEIEFYGSTSLKIINSEIDDNVCATNTSKDELEDAMLFLKPNQTQNIETGHTTARYNEALSFAEKMNTLLDCASEEMRDEISALKINLKKLIAKMLIKNEVKFVNSKYFDIIVDRVYSALMQMKCSYSSKNIEKYYNGEIYPLPISIYDNEPAELVLNNSYCNTVSLCGSGIVIDFLTGEVHAEVNGNFVYQEHFGSLIMFYNQQTTTYLKEFSKEYLRDLDGEQLKELSEFILPDDIKETDPLEVDDTTNLLTTISYINDLRSKYEKKDPTMHLE